MALYLTLIHLLIGFGFTSCSHFPLRKYYHFSAKMKWSDAQLYCRDHHTDLATFESIEEINQLSRPQALTGWLWFGLKDDTESWKGTLGNNSNSWKWATISQTITSEYQNWENGEPNFGQRNEHCVVMSTSGFWSDADCHLLQTFVCYTDIGQNQKNYEYISTPKTWEDAQSYCRQHHTDLPVITTSDENTMVHFAKPTLTVTWLALYRVPWTWSDQTPKIFTNWRSGSPNYPQSQHCVAENDIHEWDDEGCSTHYGFICHEEMSGGRRGPNALQRPNASQLEKTAANIETMQIQKEERGVNTIFKKELKKFYRKSEPQIIVLKKKTTIKIKMKIKTAAHLIDSTINDQILQKLNADLKRQGWTHFNVKWKIQPNKSPAALP